MKKNKRRQLGKRITGNAKKFGLFLGLFSLIIIVIMGGRLFKIAAIKNVNNHDLSAATRLTFMQKSTVPATRGQILSSNGSVLADNSTVYDMYAVLDKKQKVNGKPDYVTDAKKTAAALAPILGADENDLYQQLSSNKLQVELGTKAKNLSVDQYNQIKKLKLSGIKFTAQPARYYPNNRMASHIIGLTNSVSNNVGQKTLNGVLGIEAYKNKSLRGKDGLTTTLGSEVQDSKKNQVKNGDNVTLTIDEKLQATLENRMDVLYAGTKAKSAAAFVMEAKTGKIVAATQRPNFDPNTQDGLSDAWENMLNQAAFEPGSTMKTITLAAAIQEKKWQPNATYQSGTLNIDGQKVTDAFGNNAGVLTYRQAFERSSNVGFAKIEQSLGAKTWKSYLDRFHFLKKTGMELPNEQSGSISFEQPIDQANTSYGQAIRTTPAQMLQAYSAFANKGTMVKPYLVQKTTDPTTGKTVSAGKTEKVGSPVSAATAKEVLSNLEGVVNADDGTAKQYSLSDAGYQVAAKTGTAQIAENGKYLDGLTNAVHSVMALVPGDDPRYIMYIVVRQPQVFPDANIQITLNNVFRPVMLQALNDEDSTVKSATKTIEMPDVRGQSVQDAEKSLSDLGMKVASIGNSGKVTAQSIKGGQSAVKGQLVLLTASGQSTVPDFTGWTKNEILSWGNLAGVKMNLSGSGFATKQSVKVGTETFDNQTIEITFKEKG
ncbi:Cell division protein FtsI [Fructobacillus fructosus]|uniref:Peptidoglycan transpeptidase (Penicillin-binding protein 2) (FtsI) n=1 Tax=Fructobacillus fructosus TaxID=1631 RepID=A0ABM9ML46_9LACO|nr:cell division protein FtsI penicillin-binding protein 2 [Fructobacillus fructosus KCTC 3544]CAK1223667.1 Cell division protein FtsI [Fructobacillus fructosus]CAK1225095.1 Cell division protein FtsI [Fructobacillus fructosus]CAK1230756.1 Cell division protein FtsI [Fructobacillus fructosus]CAK1233901.1 Cell division protein FtsI [Fructobacillus fructosus]